MKLFGYYSHAPVHHDEANPTRDILAGDWAWGSSYDFTWYVDEPLKEGETRPEDYSYALQRAHEGYIYTVNNTQHLAAAIISIEVDEVDFANRNSKDYGVRGKFFASVDEVENFQFIHPRVKVIRQNERSAHYRACATSQAARIAARVERETHPIPDPDVILPALPVTNTVINFEGLAMWERELLVAGEQDNYDAEDLF